jgi:pyridoxal phosphate enzyme (YggS family)
MDIGDVGVARCLENLLAVRGRVAEACRRAGRDPGGVTVVAVTKYVGPELARGLVLAGCRDLAESRPQSLWAKAAALADLEPAPRWHLVGHLQRNKVRRTLEVVSLVHSLDSLRLLETCAAEAETLDTTCNALVEVNLSGDPGRTGANESEAEAIVTAAAALPRMRIRGLMGMASVPDDDQTAARREFARLREFRDRLAGRAPGGTELVELSMGMSGDYEAAILEGATLVRIGSALFEGVPRGGN